MNLNFFVFFIFFPIDYQEKLIWDIAEEESFLKQIDIINMDSLLENSYC